MSKLLGFTRLLEGLQGLERPWKGFSDAPFTGLVKAFQMLSKDLLKAFTKPSEGCFVVFPRPLKGLEEGLFKGFAQAF